jgi:hypothetical protein
MVESECSHSAEVDEISSLCAISGSGAAEVGLVDKAQAFVERLRD